MALSKLKSESMASGVLGGSQVKVHQEFGMTSFSHATTAGDDRLLLPANAADSTSHLSVAITPTSASSKILLSVNIFYEGSHGSNHEYLFDIYRDSTKLGQPRDATRRGGISGALMGYPSTNANSTADYAVFNFFDAPNTTDEITYAVAFNHSASGTLWFNRTLADSASIAYERGVSMISATEVTS